MTVSSFNELFVPLIAVLALLIFLIVVIHTFIQARTTNTAMQAMTEVIKQFRANEGWMNAVEAGITKTVPNDVVIEVMKRFDTIADLVTALLPTYDQKQLAQSFKDLADQVTDGKPNVPPDPATQTTGRALTDAQNGYTVTSKPILTLKREPQQ